jgi:ribulose-bisphosphate carboxylase large chain
MRVINDHAQRTGRKVMYAFNISDDLDSMRRHAATVEAAGGTCVMASLNWCGYSAIQALRRSTPLALHGHRNGMAMMSRHPALGMDFIAYQALWRLAGVDQLHVNGLGGKFYESDDSVIASARACLTPMAGGDAVMPVFSSGQWAGTVPSTFTALGTEDLIFLSGWGIPTAQPRVCRASATPGTRRRPACRCRNSRAIVLHWRMRWRSMDELVRDCNGWPRTWRLRR